MNNFVAIDFETGMQRPHSSISIGLVKYCNYEKIDTYYSLICPPQLYIRPDFTEIHGLVIEDVIDAPKFSEIRNDIFNFIEDMPLVAHNAPFDMGVLKASLKWYNLDVPRLSYFCSRSLARGTWPGLKSYALTSLAKEFGIVYNANNALDDAETCGKLVQMSAEKFGKEKNIEQLLKAAKINMSVLIDDDENL